MLIKSSEVLDEKHCSSTKCYWLFKLPTARRHHRLSSFFSHPIRSWWGGHWYQQSSGSKSDLYIGVLLKVMCHALVVTKILDKRLKF